MGSAHLKGAETEAFVFRLPRSPPRKQVGVCSDTSQTWSRGTLDAHIGHIEGPLQGRSDGNQNISFVLASARHAGEAQVCGRTAAHVPPGLARLSHPGADPAG